MSDGPLTALSHLRGRTDDNGYLEVNVKASSASGGDGAVLDGVDNTIRATVFDRANSNPQAVQLVDSNGDPLSGSAVSIADGASVALGTTTDPAQLDVAGTAVGHLRGIAKVLADMWDSVNHWMKVSIQNATLAVTQSGTWTVNPKANLSPATQAITVQDTGSSVATGANSQSLITGSATAASTAPFALSTIDTVRVMASGTWTGTLQLEVSFDGGTTWLINGAHQTGTAYTASAFTSNFAASVNVAGATNFRVRATAAVTGTATITVTESVDPAIVYFGNAVRLSDATTPSQQLAVGTTGAASANIAQINGVTPLMGNGVTGTGSLRMTLASDTTWTGTSNLGKAEDAVHSSSDVGVMDLGVSNEASAVFAAADQDYVPHAVNRYGHGFIARPVPTRISSNVTPVTATVTTAVAAPSAGNHLRVVRFHFSNGGATAAIVGVRDGAAGTVYYPTYLIQGAAISLNLALSGPLDLTTATRLDIYLSAAGSVNYTIDYMTVAD